MTMRSECLSLYQSMVQFYQEFSIFYIYVYVYIETGTKLVLESRAPPFGRLWRSVMRGENVVGERGCYNTYTVS